LAPLLFSFQFPTNGESKIERYRLYFLFVYFIYLILLFCRAERKAEADRLAKKTVLGRAKIGIFGKSK
jgi:hypothetical protein